MIKNSVIYNGKVIHRRFKPKEHYFKYNVFSLLIDLDELEIIQNKIKITSVLNINEDRLTDGNKKKVKAQQTERDLLVYNLLVSM